MNETYYSINLNNEIKNIQPLPINKNESLIPLYEFTLEYENGKKQVVSLNPNLKPEEIAYNFCKENNLDFESLLLIKDKISAAMESISKKDPKIVNLNHEINDPKFNYLNEPILEDSAEQQSLSIEKISKIKNFKDLISNNSINKTNINNENDNNFNIYKILDKENNNLYNQYLLTKHHSTSPIVKNTINNCMEILEKEEKPSLSSEIQESSIICRDSENNNYISSCSDIKNNIKENNNELIEKENKNEEIFCDTINENSDLNKTKKRETICPEPQRMITKAITYINKRVNENSSNKTCNTLNNSSNINNKNNNNNKIRKYNSQFIVSKKRKGKNSLFNQNKNFFKNNNCKEKLMDISKIIDSNNNYSCSKKTTLVTKRNLSTSENILTESNTRKNFYTVKSIKHEIDFNILSENKPKNIKKENNILHKYFSSFENRKYLFSYDKLYKDIKNKISINNFNSNIKKNYLNKKIIKISPDCINFLPHNEINTCNSIVFSRNNKHKSPNISNINFYSPLIIKNYYKNNDNYSNHNINCTNQSKSKLKKTQLMNSDCNINSKNENKHKNNSTNKIKKYNTYRNIYYNKSTFQKNSNKYSNLSDNYHSNDNIFKEKSKINNIKTKSFIYHSKLRYNSVSNITDSKNSVNINPPNKNIIKIKSKEKTIYDSNNYKKGTKKLNRICVYNKRNKIFFDQKNSYFYNDSSYLSNYKTKKNIFMLSSNSNKNIRTKISPTNFNTGKNTNVSTLTNSVNFTKIENNYNIINRPSNIKLFHNPKVIEISNISSSDIINYGIRCKNLSNSSNAISKFTKTSNRSLLRNSSSLTISLEKKNKISNSLKNIFLYLSKGNNYLDVFQLLETNKNHLDIYPMVQKIIKNCDQKQRFIFMKDFIEKGKIVFEKLPEEEQKIIFNFKEIT